MTLFPSIQPQAAEVDTTLPLYREVKWDYENDIPVFRDGVLIFVDGAEAVIVWAWKALRTPRYQYDIYTWNFGNEAEQLIGQPFTEETKKAEAARFVRECLQVNPYITSVSDVSVSFSDSRMTIAATIKTIYGEVSINV